MSTGYLDAFAGLSGDMIAGAVFDSGADFTEFERAAAGLGLGGYRLALKRRNVSGTPAAKFEVEVFERQPALKLVMEKAQTIARHRLASAATVSPEDKS